MNDMQLIRHSESEETFLSKTGNFKVSKKYSKGALEVAIYTLNKDTNFFINQADQAGSYKTYFLISGSLLNVETKQYLYPGDLWIVDHTQVHLHMTVLEEAQIQVQAYADNLFGTWLNNEVGIDSILSDIQNKDDYTKDHCNNVFTYATHVAKKLGLKGTDLYYLNKAAHFHDVGKVYIDDAILNKPGKLTQEEYTLMMGHVEKGRDLIIKYFPQEVFDIIAEHHERLDGSGYPKGLKGDEISIGGRILSVCDCYDAMITDRVYKKGISPKEAVSQLKALSGTLLDPLVVDALIAVLALD